MLELADILQMDVTVIAGILILLTITSYKVSKSDSKKFFRGFTKEGMTALVVTPFAASALISLFRCMIYYPITDCTLEQIDLVLPIAGFLYLILVVYLIARYSRVKPKENKYSKFQILFDEMYDGKDIELEKKGYDTFSVKKIRLTGEPLQYDYSVLKYVEENKMILITEDSENYGGCQENNLLCIKLGQNPSIEEIIKGLESLKINYDIQKV